MRAAADSWQDFLVVARAAATGYSEHKNRFDQQELTGVFPSASLKTAITTVIAGGLPRLFIAGQRSNIEWEFSNLNRINNLINLIKLQITLLIVWCNPPYLIMKDEH